jgi:hypothetical protein
MKRLKQMPSKSFPDNDLSPTPQKTAGWSMDEDLMLVYGVDSAQVEPDSGSFEQMARLSLFFERRSVADLVARWRKLTQNLVTEAWRRPWTQQHDEKLKLFTLDAKSLTTEAVARHSLFVGYNPIWILRRIVSLMQETLMVQLKNII